MILKSTPSLKLKTYANTGSQGTKAYAQRCQAEACRRIRAPVSHLFPEYLQGRPT